MMLHTKFQLNTSSSGGKAKLDFQDDRRGCHTEYRIGTICII